MAKDISNDERWSMVANIETIITNLLTLAQSQEVIIKHTLHYDPQDPGQSLDSIYDEANHNKVVIEQLQLLISASWAAVVAQINGIPVQLPMTPSQVEELRKKLER